MTTAPPRVRVLVVDDSAFARKVFRLALSADPRIEVVGTATDGLDALEKIEVLKPHVVTLDLMMPNLDGLGVLRALAELKHRPAVVLVTISDSESELVVTGLQLGAVSLVQKPTALATQRLYEASGALVKQVLEAALTHSQPVVVPERSRVVVGFRGKSGCEVVVIGTSTGGPQALTQLVAKLPADFPVPIAIALHIPGEYTKALAQRLDQASALEVVEAYTGLPLAVGQVIVAKGGEHLTLERGIDGVVRARVSGQPSDALYFPSVDLLFSSAAHVFGATTVGVVLTGMGDDGLHGSRAIVEGGGLVLTEAESSCIVYGMPRVVKEAGLSKAEARIEQMAEELVRRV